MSKSKFPLRKGDIICYRSHLGKVLEVDAEGVLIKGPYTTQKIDWEDVQYYNKDIKL